MEHIAYTQDNFNRDMTSLVDQLKYRQFDLIVGVNRGGCLPAVCLSHSLGIPATMIDFSTRDGVNIHPQSLYGYFEGLSDKYQDILIVDDLVDSGTAMKKLINTASQFCTVSVATLLHNVDVDLSVDHYWGTPYSRQIETRYFDFWWEVYK